MHISSKIPLLLVLTTFLLTFPACNNKNAENSDLQEVNQVDLYESSLIIKELIYSGKLNMVFAPSVTKEELDDLIINYSPVTFAFEAEVLQHFEPVCVIFYDSGDSKLINDLKKLVNQTPYMARFKWVYVDNNKLSSLTQECQITQLPALLVFKDREEIANYIPMTNICECENILKATHENQTTV